MITKGYYKNKEVAHKLSVLCIKPYCTCNTDPLHCTCQVKLEVITCHLMPWQLHSRNCYSVYLSLFWCVSIFAWWRQLQIMRQRGCSVLCHLRCVHTPVQVFHDVNSQEEELRHHLHPILIDVNWFNVVVLALNVFRIRLLSLHHVVSHSSSSL